jgi:hypothetical protein
LLADNKPTASIMKNMYQTTDELMMKGLPDLDIQMPAQAFSSEGKWFSTKPGPKTAGAKKRTPKSNPI